MSRANRLRAPWASFRWLNTSSAPASRNSLHTGLPGRHADDPYAGSQACADVLRCVADQHGCFGAERDTGPPGGAPLGEKDQFRAVRVVVAVCAAGQIEVAGEAEDFELDPRHLTQIARQYTLVVGGLVRETGEDIVRTWQGTADGS